MRNIELFYMWEPQRESFIESHNFYVEQAQKRLISQFNNLNEEAENYGEKWLEEAGKCFDPERHDPGEFYEEAHEKTIEYGMLLSEMRAQTILSVIAGMYHQWDKTLREWMVQGARLWGGDNIFYKIWKVDISKIFDLFESLDWNIRNEEFFHKLDACRLIVNIYKHGNGDSVHQLKKKYPNYFYDFVSQDFHENGWFDHNLIDLKDEYVEEFSASILDFWRKVPEHFFDSESLVIPSWLKEALIADNQSKKIKR